MRDDGNVVPANGNYTEVLEQSDPSLFKSAEHGLVLLINDHPQGKADTTSLGFGATQDRGWPSSRIQNLRSRSSQPVILARSRIQAERKSRIQGHWHSTRQTMLQLFAAAAVV